MIRKKMLLLSVFLTLIVSAFNLNAIGVSAVEYPVIYSSPAWVHTDDPAAAVGTSYTFSVKTDYTGSDVWAYEFKLTFNPNVLEGVEVVNGDLITDTTLWIPGTFDNTAGKLSLTENAFYFLSPPPPLASGPAILANITFTVVGYGISSITFVEDETRLIGYAGDFYDIIDVPLVGDIEGGVFYNTIKGDTDGDGLVDLDDLFYILISYGMTIEEAMATYGIPPGTDIDNDGTIDLDDLFYVLWNYGT